MILADRSQFFYERYIVSDDIDIFYKNYESKKSHNCYTVNENILIKVNETNYDKNTKIYSFGC